MRLLISHSKFTRIFVETPALRPLGRVVWDILFGIAILGVRFAYRLSIIRDVFSKLQILDVLKVTQRLQYITILFFLHGSGRLTCSGIDALPSFPAASAIPFFFGVCININIYIYIWNEFNKHKTGYFHSCSLARAPSLHFSNSHSAVIREPSTQICRWKQDLSFYRADARWAIS